MSTTWLNWCRLCAAETNSGINLFIKDESGSRPLLANKINNYFSILISANDGLSQFICDECFQYLEGVDKFAERCSRTYAMLIDLKECKSSRNAQKIRRKYGFIKDEVGSTDSSLDSDEEKDVDFESVNTEFNTMEWNEEEEEEDILETDVCAVKLEDPQDETNEETPSKDQLNVNQLNSCKKIAKHCPHCDRRFTSNVPFQKHLQNAHQMDLEMENFECDNCKEIFHDKKSLRKHTSICGAVKDKKTSGQCKICEKNFESLQKLQVHIKAVHLDERPFVCEECGKKFRTLHNLQEHRTIHSDEKNFLCDVCQRGFKTKGRLKDHLETHSDTVHICPICGLKLKTRRNLNNHKVVHSDVKKHMCTICDSAFKRRKNYKQHMKVKHSTHNTMGYVKLQG